MKTIINEMLGCKYPIIMGGMQWITKSEFVAKIVDSGGFGFISASSFGTPEKLEQDIRRLKSLTDKPFGVNLSMLPGETNNEKIYSYLDIILQEKIAVLETSGRNPQEIVRIVKPFGVNVLHKVTSPQHAISAEKSGVNAIIAIGYEAAGHPGMSRIGTFINLPTIVRSVKIPVVAAGGICDGRSMASAFCLGADGILMGTRFLATKEAPIHENIKKWIINASVNDTAIIQRTIKNAMRCIANQQACRVLSVEAQDASFHELYPLIKGRLAKAAWKTGRYENAIMAMGQSSGLIQDIPTVDKLIKNILGDFDKTVEDLQKLEDF